MTSIIKADNISTVSGSGNITIPTGVKVVGTDAGSIVAPGQVLQTIYSTFNTQVYQASLNTNSTGHSATITPKFANSKILVQHMGTVYNEGDNLHQYRTVYRGSTNLAPSGEGLTLHSAASGNNGRWSSIGFNILDNPATTSAITYTIYFRGNSSSANSYYCYGTNYPQTLILQEIAQ